MDQVLPLRFLAGASEGLPGPRHCCAGLCWLGGLQGAPRACWTALLPGRGPSQLQERILVRRRRCAQVGRLGRLAGGQRGPPPFLRGHDVLGARLLLRHILPGPLRPRSEAHRPAGPARAGLLPLLRGSDAVSAIVFRHGVHYGKPRPLHGGHRHCAGPLAFALLKPCGRGRHGVLGRGPERRAGRPGVCVPGGQRRALREGCRGPPGAALLLSALLFSWALPPQRPSGPAAGLRAGDGAAARQLWGPVAGPSEAALGGPRGAAVERGGEAEDGGPAAALREAGAGGGAGQDRAAHERDGRGAAVPGTGEE
mmetsp:Transcript_80306/g.239152  ORF Transcript_80306/g.239152 Transcript_80306/m.239152 type:complete len:311 (-) Transcript_80306:803-1735(-)